MSSNFMTNVPKLKGRENFDEWAFAVENLLVLDGADKYLKSEGTGALDAAADAKARAKIILTIDSSLFVHIKYTKTTKELWTKLRSLFDDSGFSRRITLLRRLISIRLEDCDSMTSYVTQIVETSQRLSSTGFEINDEWVGSLLLAGLPERFMPMIMAVEHSGIQITTDTIKSKLLDMEPADGGETERNSALIAKWQKKKTKNVNGIISKYAEQTSKYVNKCFKCKEVGHYRKNCPLLNQKTDSLKQNTAFSTVFLSGAFSKNDFYIDSGASKHMTANENWLKNPTYSTDLPEIIMANKTKVPVLCAGDVEVKSSFNYDITVKNVLCVPHLTTNLLSVSELIKNGNSVVFKPSKCLIRNKMGYLVAEAELIDGVYKLKLKTQKCLMTKVTGQTWYRRLGHINRNDMNKMKRCGLVDGLDFPDVFTTSKSSSEICCEGKKSRQPFIAGSRATEKWDRKYKKHILVGFRDNIKGRDVVILEQENKRETVSVSIENTDSVGETEEEKSESEYMDSLDEIPKDEKKENMQDEEVQNDLPANILHNKQRDNEHKPKKKRESKKPIRYGYVNLCTTSMDDDDLTFADAAVI